MYKVYDYLDVSDSKDDFDNITLGSPAEKIEIEEEEDIPYEGDGLEDDNDNDEEQTPKFVKNVNLWNGEITGGGGGSWLQAKMNNFESNGLSINTEFLS